MTLTHAAVKLDDDVICNAQQCLGLQHVGPCAKSLCERLDLCCNARRYSKEWEKTVTRLGRWIDFENDYKTMDPSFMESVWWVFSQLWGKGLVYKGFKVRV